MAKNKWYVWQDKQGVHIDDEPCKSNPVREAVIINDRAPKWAEAAFEVHQYMMREQARIKLANAQTLIEQKVEKSLEEVILYAKIEKNLCGFDAIKRVQEMSKRYSGDYIFNAIFAPRMVVNNA